MKRWSVAILILLLLTLTASVRGWLGTNKPAAAIEYAAGSWLSDASTGILHDVIGSGDTTRWFDADVTSLASIIGYAHAGQIGLSQSEANARVTAIQIWGWLDTNGDGIANIADSQTGARTTKWVKLSELTPGGGSNYENEVLGDAPFAYYRLGELSGATAADATGSFNGTYANTPTLGVAGAIVGDSDTAVTFDSVSSEKMTATLQEFSLSSTSFECWIKTTTSTSDRWIFSTIEETLLYEFSAVYNHDGNADRLNIKSVNFGSGLEGYVTANLNDGDWHHLVVTANEAATTIHVWLDTVDLSVTYTQTDNPGLGAQIFVFTLAAGAGTFTDAAFDEVGVYDRVLTSGEIASHYATTGESGAAAGNVVGWEVATSAPDTTSAWADILQTANGGTAIPLSAGQSWLLLIRAVASNGDTNLMDAAGGSESWENGDTSDGIGSDDPADVYGLDADGTADIADAAITWVYVRRVGVTLLGRRFERTIIIPMERRG